MTEAHSYDKLRNDPTSLKQNLFSDNPAESLQAEIALIGMHNSQLNKKYKLPENIINKYRGEESTTEDLSDNKKENIQKAIEHVEKYPRTIDQEQQQQEKTITSEGAGSEEEYYEIEDATTEETSIDSEQNSSQTKLVYTTDQNDGILAPHTPIVTNDFEENNSQTTYEEMLEIDSEENEKQISNQLQTVTKDSDEAMEEYKDGITASLKRTKNSSENGKEKKTDKTTLSWGIPRAIKLNEQLNEFYGKSDKKKKTEKEENEEEEKEKKDLPDMAQNLAKFPDFLTLVRKCLLHAGILTMGHPTFQAKIGSLTRKFLKLKTEEWDKKAYGQHSANDTFYLSELNLNKIELLNAYENEVKKLFDKKEQDFDSIAHIAKSGFESAANKLTFGIYKLVKRGEKKRKYSQHLDDTPKKEYEEKMKKGQKDMEYIKNTIERTTGLQKKFYEKLLKSTRNKVLDPERDRTVAQLNKEINSLDEKIEKAHGTEKLYYRAKKKEKEYELAKYKENQTIIEERLKNITYDDDEQTDEKLTEQIEDLDDKIEQSHGMKKLYYRAKQKNTINKLTVANIEARVEDDLKSAYEQQRNSFDTIIGNSDDQEIVGNAIAESKNAEKGVNRRVQKHAAIENHEHLAMALHLIVSTIRDDNNNNPFYRTSSDADTISALCNAYITPYYDEPSSSSSKDTFDKFELKPDNESNKLLQRMLAVIMVYDENNLLNNSGIKAVFNGENPDIFDVNRGSKIWEKNSFKFDTVNFTQLLTDCKRINSAIKNDRCYKSYNTIFEKTVFNQEFNNGLDNAKSKEILSCFCGNAGTDVQQKVYEMLKQPEFSFKNIKPLLDKVYEPKSQDSD